MRYRVLGETGLLVSEIGFGTIPILSGNAMVLPDYYSPDDKAAVEIMNYALGLGCNLFDTAIIPEYGDAERKLGLFAAQTNRSKLVLSDKARYYDGNQMYEAVLRSYETLGTYADLYFVHQVDEDNAGQVFGRYGAIEALAEQKKEGRIRHVGIASHYYSILKRGALDGRVDLLQGSGNILERGMLDRILSEPLFLKKGILINKVYAAGLLPSYFPAKTLISGVLSYPVSSALIGIGTIHEVDAAVRSVTAKEAPKDSFSLITFDEVLSVLEQSFQPIPCDRCQQCRCPFGTEIHTIFRQYNYYHLGKEYWALKKLALGIRQSAAACAACVEMPCLKQCKRNLFIPRLIQEVWRLVSIHLVK